MDPQLLRNARIVLEVSCRTEPGESVLIITKGKEPTGKGYTYSRALAAAAAELGAMPTIANARN